MCSRAEAVLFLIAAVVLEAAGAQSTDLRILVAQGPRWYPRALRACSANVTAAGCEGGMPAMAARFRAEAAGAHATLRLVGPDITSVNLWYPGGWTVNELVHDRLGVDAALIDTSFPIHGSDFDSVYRWLSTSRRPQLITNYALGDTYTNTVDGHLVRAVMLHAGGIRVGVLQVWSPDGFARTIPLRLVVSSNTDSLRRRGADTVLLICGDEGSLWKLYKSIDFADFGADIVLPPHCNNRTGCADDGDAVFVSGTWVAPGIDRGQVGPFGSAYAALDITLDALTRRPRAVGVRSVPLRWLPDPLINSAQYKADQEWLQQTVVEPALGNNPLVGRSNNKMPRSQIHIEGFGTNYLCRVDACVSGTFAAETVHQRFPECDISLTNGGALRNNGWDTGPVYLRDIFNLMPYLNKLCTFNTTGPELYRILEQYVQDVPPDGPYNRSSQYRGGFPQTSGLRYEFDPYRPKRRKLLRADARNGDGVWEPLRRGRHYSVVTNDFLCNGGDSFDLEKIGLTFHPLTAQDFLIDRFRRAGDSGLTMPEAATIVFPNDSRPAFTLLPLGPGDCGPTQRHDPQWEDCVACPEGMVADPVEPMDCTHPPRADADGTWIWVLIGVGGLTLIVVPPVVWRLTENWRRIRRMHSKERIAASCAESIAAMRLEEVAYIKEIAKPDRIQRAFIDIINVLAEYRTFLPQALLDRQRGSKEREAAPDSSSASPAEGALPQRQILPRQRLLPQLAAPKVRGALKCVVSQTAGAEREAVGSLLRERLETCLKVGDHVTAARLAQCGWDPPPELRGDSDQLAGARESVYVDLLASSFVDAAHLDRPMDASTLVAASSTVGEQAPTTRFSDGADAPGDMIATVSLFPSEYSAPAPIVTVTGLSTWHDPRGVTHWPREAAVDILADYALCHPDPCDEVYATLYTYTAEINHGVVWVIWLGTRWRLYENQDAKAVASDFQLVVLDHDDLLQVGLETHRAGHSLERIAQHPSGVTVFGAGGEALLVRYENKQGGGIELSPLKDTAVWVPAPGELVSQTSPFSVVRPGKPPIPPGILEYITSRDYNTSLTQQNWVSRPVRIRGLENLRQACTAQKNQQRPVERLCQRAREVFNSASDAVGELGVDQDKLAAAVPVLYKVKCPAPSPTPAQIAHASELGVLCWRGENFLLATTGGPRCVTPLDETLPSCKVMWRIGKPWSAQPYHLMNSAMRSQQDSKCNAELRVDSGPSRVFISRQQEHAPAAPAPAYFEAQGEQGAASAVWSGAAWNITYHGGGSGTVKSGILLLNAWGLPQYRALIWHLDNLLRGMPQEAGAAGKGRKGYRGLAGVQLDPVTYSRGKVVTFGAFTSTSYDQGVAAGFAATDACAAIFTMFGHSGRSISKWSRFGREKEMLYPPNTLHLVTEALSAEHAAILDRQQLQVFDLQELAPAEAMHHLAKAGALEIRDHPNVLKLAERARDRAVDGDWVGAARALLQEPEAECAIERRFALPVIPKEAVGVVALLFTSSTGSEVGPGIDTVLWSDFFQRAEQVAVARGARIMATHVGAMLIQVSGGSADVAAGSAIKIAVDLVSGNFGSPGGRLKSATAAHAAGDFRPTGSQLAVHCGVAVGTVHAGFAGSAAHRVEIADGPAVRRARRMAGYAVLFKITDVVAEAACTQAAARAGLTSWIMDLVAFESASGRREPIFCVSKGVERDIEQEGMIDQSTAARIQAAWDAVMQAVEDEAECDLQGFLDAIPAAVSEHRSVRALHEAAAQPLAYCHDLLVAL